MQVNMADDIAKSNFSDILSNLNRNFEITDSKWSEDRLYQIIFRTKIAIEDEDYNKYCDRWVDDFSDATDTIWVHKISNTGAKVKFRKLYQCWVSKSKVVNKDLLFDPRKCRATLDIKVLGNNYGKKVNRYLQLGLNAIVKINFEHLHSVDVGRNYAFFVHWCDPLVDIPKPTASSTEKVTQLIAKVVENAPKTSRKAAEKVKQALKRQRLEPPSFSQNLSSSHLSEITQLPMENQSRSVTKQSSMAQVIINSSEQQPSDNFFYVQEVLFDSATQTLTKISSTNTEVHNLSNSSLIQLQTPSESIHIPPASGLTNNQIIQEF